MSARLTAEQQSLSAQSQMAFQERMSNTAHQREVEDLKAAGLNPVLSSGGSGASTPNGAEGDISGTQLVGLLKDTINTTAKAVNGLSASIENVTGKSSPDPFDPADLPVETAGDATPEAKAYLAKRKKDQRDKEWKFLSENLLNKGSFGALLTGSYYGAGAAAGLQAAKPILKTLLYSDGFDVVTQRIADSIVLRNRGYSTKQCLNFLKTGIVPSRSSGSAQGEWAGNQKYVHAPPAGAGSGHWQGTTVDDSGFSHHSGTF